MGFLCKIYILHTGMSKLMQRSVKNHNVSTAHDSEHLHLTCRANGLKQTRSLRCNSCIFAAFSGSGLACLIRICFNLSQALWNQIRVKREHAFKTQEEASNYSMTDISTYWVSDWFKWICMYEISYIWTAQEDMRYTEVKSTWQSKTELF